MADFNLDAYFSRIGLKENPCAGREGLVAVQRAHRLSIPFENLDIPLGRGISLDPTAVFDKLVVRRRGGYCFEQNQLFLRALLVMGFEARPLLARVWLMAEGVPPRTHTFNLVQLEGEQWIADAGFGGSFTPPMPLEAGRVVQTDDGVRHRLTIDSHFGWMLERDSGDGIFQPQYSFELDAVWPGDLVMANHFTSTKPLTRFTTLRIVSIPTATGHAALTDRHFSTSQGDSREIADLNEYREILAGMFGLTLSATELERLGLFDD